MRLILFLLTVFIFAIVFGSATVQAIESSGYISALYDRNIGTLPQGHTVDSKVEMEGRLKLQTKFKKHMRGVFALDAAVYDREVVPSRLYIDYKPDRTWRLRIGYTKKVLGLSYEQNKENLLSIYRAPIYEKMDSSGLTGRQLAIALRLRQGRHKRNTMSLAFSHDGSRNTNVTWSAIHRIQAVKGFNAGLWGIVEMRSFKTVGRLVVVADAAAFWYQRRSARFAFEVIHGIDPDATHFEMLFHNSRKVQFLSPRVEAAYRYRLSRNVSLQPLFQASMMYEDLQYRRNNSLQFLGGVNLQIHQLVVSVNVETIGSNAPKDVDARRYEQKNIYAEIVYYF